MKCCKACLLTAAIAGSLVLSYGSLVCRAEEMIESEVDIEQTMVVEDAVHMAIEGQSKVGEPLETASQTEIPIPEGVTETAEKIEIAEDDCQVRSDDEEWEVVEVDGEVYVEPQFSWTDKKKGLFQTEYAVTNHSAVIIPETEIKIALPDTDGFIIEKVFIANGKDIDARLAVEEKERKSVSCFVQNFPVEKQFTIRATGKSVDIETNRGLSEQEREEEKEKKKAIKNIRIAVILRGYGLEHAVNGKYRIPERGMPKPRAIRQVGILTVNLVDAGKAAMEVLLESGIMQKNSIFMNAENGEGHRKLHFLSMKNIRTEVMMAKLYKLLAVIIVGFSVFWVSERMLMKRQLHRAENARRFHN